MDEIKYNDICLWVQASSTDEKDIVIKDNHRLELGDEYKEVSLYAVSIKSKYRLIDTPNKTQLYQIPNIGYMIMSNLNDVDEVNRKRAFSAIIKAETFDNCWNKLCDTLISNGFSPNKDDYQIFKDSIEFYNSKKKIVRFVLIIVSLVVLLVILLILLKQK